MASHTNDSDEGFEPIISNRLAIKLVSALAGLVLIAGLITTAGHWLGQRMASGGHTESAEVFDIAIGSDIVSVPANMIRLAEQRASGKASGLNLYLTWPEMQGYSAAERGRFDTPDTSNDLIFVELSEATMSRDMSGRFEPIYQRLLSGDSTDFGHGLTLHHLKADSGYGDEVLLSAHRPGKPDYVVRCLLPQRGQEASSADCQRDIHAGNGLSILYRFSSKRLAEWDHIDAAIGAFVANRLTGQKSDNP
ncbi:hypothetical protein MUU53_03335 [Rhizobium lemnae]|uniref:Transmembrane anchored protein n=1 Tax=Rhizobium lemnae TaxID=1214924 RepID=A0ABV8EB32_9HYPH|nr:hypothetical protein [Rhizobium lemnae]MCJ8506943.1 hypothetical protein [Rhizobium lemnae]